MLDFENHSCLFLESFDSEFIVQIHGGAWDIPSNLKKGHRDGVQEASFHAMRLLKMRVPALEVIVATLEVLENDPVFDAGMGSFLNEHGKVELDAAVMEGSLLRAGAVAAIGSFPNPSRIALHLCQHTDTVLLVGTGAEEYALQSGFQKVPDESLVAEREIQAWNLWKQAGCPDPKRFFSEDSSLSLAGQNPEKRGTVGVVIGVKNHLQKYDLYAGTSTGGTPGKKAGRVGDVPLVGCGLYADNHHGAAVSCTGWGEGLIRVSAAKAVSERVRMGKHPQEAVESVLQDLWIRTEGKGGIIAIDTLGRQGCAFTTPNMAYAGKQCFKLNTQSWNSSYE